MRKNVWLINHYATGMFQSKRGRHYYFAKYLKQNGYCPIIICSSFMHKGTTNYIQDDCPYSILEQDGIIFLFIKTSAYLGNGKQRIKNMIEFAGRLVRHRKKIIKDLGEPDVIIGSSVHPLTCVAGIIMAKKVKCKVISEIRDLWPETLVMFGSIKENSLAAKILYWGERWIYQKSDDVIFTMEGGKQYIIDRGWESRIDLKKVHYINNGVDLEQFYNDIKNEVFEDKELESTAFKIIYTGTISKANDVGRLIKAAEKIQLDFAQKIIFLIYGHGEEKEELEKYCIEHKIKNVIFKGQVSKKKIPYILSKGDLLVVNYAKEIFESKHNVLRYGGSHNKLFEYLAAGKPILYTQPSSYNLVEKYHCGKVLNDSETVESLVRGILEIYRIDVGCYNEMSRNSRRAVMNFDFCNLTQKLIEVIEK
ncbi:glycosyltransferase family 4 protein [Anaerostipes sp.]|uniref:glycosyltransferase family 4 protein n=1 Tax=Anaerostipes sp. TaxID=1872530 RepID=UPI0025BBAAB0|nr:glycosyltransferase family 4 protein [Anaerostipes sp.]MBS7007115.1 glycosyltransferase family 4 protein [Anaerostipes sp.]